MPQQTTGDMGLNMFNDAKAAISMGKMDGLLRRVRHLELRVKYCQHLHKTRKLSITHWKGEENPADGLTKSSKPLSLWTNLVEAVGLVPGPKEQGSNWQAVGEEDDPRTKRNFQMWTVMGKLVTSNARLMSHRLVQVNEKLDVLGEWLRKDCESGQSCFEETRVTMADFAKKFDVLSEAIKFMSATSKTSAHEEAEVKKKMMVEFANSREVLSHIRGNTGTTNKKIGDLLWQIGELRTGGSQKDTSDNNGGSLLSVLEVQLDNIASSLKEEFGKLSADLRTAVERGVDPEKSLVVKKRKEMRPIDPAPEKRVKYFHPLTGQALEGTAAEREAHMREWMAAYQGGTPVTPSGPSFMAHLVRYLRNSFRHQEPFHWVRVWWTRPGFGMKNLPILLHDVLKMV